MKLNQVLDKDNCLSEELIPNSVEWQKEKNGDNILLQYINGGEGFRAIASFPENVKLDSSHYNGKSLFIRTNEGQLLAYHQDKRGNFKTLPQLKKEQQANSARQGIFMVRN